MTTRTEYDFSGVHALRDIAGFTYQYREFVAGSRWYQHAGQRNSFEINYVILGIAGEAGECADAWKKVTREISLPEAWETCTDERRMKIVHEAGDTLWYIQALCITLGIDVQELMLLNTVKLYERLKQDGREVAWPLPKLTYEQAKETIRRTEKQVLNVSRG